MAETHAGTPSAWQRRLLGLGLIVAGLLLIATLVEVWPAATATGDDEHSVGLLFGIVDEAFTPDEALLLLIATAGGLGAAVNTATEFAYRVGDDRLDRSYLWWYPMRFLIAATLALIFYFVVRGGLLDPTTNASANLNVYVFAGLAGLAGMFSTQATRLLGAIFGSLPGAEETYSGPAPKVSALVPSDRDEKGDPGELVLRGHGFSEGARARRRQAAADTRDRRHQTRRSPRSRPQAGSARQRRSPGSRGARRAARQLGSHRRGHPGRRMRDRVLSAVTRPLGRPPSPLALSTTAMVPHALKPDLHVREEHGITVATYRNKYPGAYCAGR